MRDVQAVSAYITKELEELKTSVNDALGKASRLTHFLDTLVLNDPLLGTGLENDVNGDKAEPLFTELSQQTALLAVVRSTVDRLLPTVEELKR